MEGLRFGGATGGGWVPSPSSHIRAFMSIQPLQPTGAANSVSRDMRAPAAAPAAELVRSATGELPERDRRWYLTSVFVEGHPMDQTLIVRGRYAGRTFIPDGPLPDAEGTAELVITPTAPQAV